MSTSLTLLFVRIEADTSNSNPPKTANSGQYSAGYLQKVVESIQGIHKLPTYRFEDTIVCERWYFWRSEINIDYRMIQCIRGFCSSPLPIFKLGLQVPWIDSNANVQMLTKLCLIIINCLQLNISKGPVGPEVQNLLFLLFSSILVGKKNWNQTLHSWDGKYHW